MVGIVAYGAYIPWHRMDRQQCVKAWGGFGMPGEKAVAYFDEDSVTMGVAAAIDCLGDGNAGAIDGLYFATTSAPYKEKQSAAIMAIALGLRRDVRTADMTTSLRAGTIAFGMALDAIKAGTASNVMVTAADMRLAAPAGMTEQGLGDGAAAFLLGKENVIAEIQGTYSITDELAGTWRAADDTFIRSWEDRMVQDEGYSTIIPEALNGIMKKYGLKPKDFTKVVFDSPVDGRRHGKVASTVGFDASQIQEPFSLFLKVGLTGCASAPMMLVLALEQAKPGDKILYAGSGDGVDAFILQVTDAITNLPARRGIKGHLASKKMMESYNTYLTWRGIVPQEEARRPAKTPARLSAMWRERKQQLGLWGIKCRKCGTIQYDDGAAATTPIRICAVCGAKDNFDDYGFSRKKAKVFSYTHDNLAPVADPPASVVLVDFEGGGRAFFDLTDRDPKEIAVGTEVEMTFRRMQVNRGLSIYHWKARPVR
ncbi:MAG: 3-hydroxy-3-methylglutaryl CoA synthase [Chloroflexi bacterium]|nr:3-hydroxy-3-methylglutaryl CoA synthase [Chloroflexota bacterium]